MIENLIQAREQIPQNVEIDKNALNTTNAENINSPLHLVNFSISMLESSLLNKGYNINRQTSISIEDANKTL